MIKQIDKSAIKYNYKADLSNKGKARLYAEICLLLILISLISVFVILLDVQRPYYYNSLYLLPLSFILLLVLNYRNFDKALNNFGVMMIIALEFIRLVVSPAFLVWSDYYEVITLNVGANTPQAIGLLVYETVVIALAIRLPSGVKRERTLSQSDYCRSISALNKIMLLYTVILAAICIFAPEILLAHRSFLGVFTDKSYTSMTFDAIIAANSTGLKHYLLMLSRLLLTPYRLLLPAYLIVVLRYKYKRRFRWLSWLISFFPLFMVNDVIAQSLYFTMFLLLLNCYLDKVSYKVITAIIIASALAVIIYFCGRYSTYKTDDDSMVMDFSERFITYFSGLNMVTGSFNQPSNLDNKFQYLLYDFLTAIPFNKTLLGLDPSVSSASLFHKVNSISGEIPTTIGMCYYYFGFVLAPLYSFALARLAKRSGLKLQKSSIPLLRLVYTFCAFILALGIVMYNVEIACNILVQIVLPIYIVAKLSFRRYKSDT